MRKEIFFAILAGGLLGLIIAFGIWRINIILAPKKQAQTEDNSISKPKSEFLVTIAKPEEKDVAIEAETIISGVTKPGSYVGISSKERDYLTIADSSGAFEKEIELAGGANYIQLVAFDEQGESSGTVLTLVYSSEFAKSVPATSAIETEDTATAEAEGVREKVQKKVESALKKPKAYIGTVTDISEATIQIKNEGGEIQQIAVQSAATFIKTGKTQTAVKFSDLAIGDYIVAMGLRNGNSVLEAKRILITAAETTKRQIFFGKVAKPSKNELTIKLVKGGEDFKTTVSGNTDVLLQRDGKVTAVKYANLKEGDLVFLFTTASEKGFEARTIILFETAPSPPPEN